ncbi:MAG: hypothetical protein ACOCG5_05520 [Candidatus Alkaliphilus sp. MAG34]|nr:hypothetical protein [Clostridiales bacterium]
MSAYIFIIVGIIFVILIYLLLQSLRTKLFDKYFQIYLDESYNLDDLFPIKIQGKVLPKVDFLDIPYENLNIEISTKTIRGTINSNTLSLELIKPGDRKTSVYLVKTHYTKAVKPYIKETIKNKKEYISLVRMSTKQRHNLEKLACQTCKHKVQCQISFTECNYEREPKDTILRKGIKVNTNKNYELNN